MAKTSTRGRSLIGPTVAATLDALDLADEDQAAAQLARRYAHDLDNAAVVAATLTKALRDLAAVDVDLHDRFLVLATRIEETAVLAALGPKLHALLESLGATPKARAAAVKGVPANAGSDSNSRQTALDELRARREQRRGPRAD